MLSATCQIARDYAFEIAVLHPIRKLSDGLTPLKFKLNSDWFKGDHNPRYELELIFMNVMIIEMRIYNIHHQEDRSQ
jgi:hypothetical protein